jgi:hypothetical protein
MDRCLHCMQSYSPLGIHSGLCGGSVYHFLRNLLTDFHSGWTTLHSQQQCVRVLCPHHPHQHLCLFAFMIAILAGVRWNLNVLLISWSSRFCLLLPFQCRHIPLTSICERWTLSLLPSYHLLNPCDNFYICRMITLTFCLLTMILYTFKTYLSTFGVHIVIFHCCILVSYFDSLLNCLVILQELCVGIFIFF